MENAARALIEDTKYQMAARRIAKSLKQYDCASRFAGVLREPGA